MNREILIPAYFDPTDSPKLWTQLNNAANSKEIVAIANPNNGPGKKQQESYASAINALKTNGGKTVGYILSGYGKRGIDLMKKDIDNWLTWYPGIDGIFVDEMSNTNKADHINLYQDIFNYIKGKNTNLRVIGNPGINTLEAYMPTVDTVIIYEDTQANFKSYKQDAWNLRYDASRFGMLFYNATEADMNSLGATIDTMHVGSRYCTNDKLNNPWDSLPVYFDALISSWANKNSTPVEPTPIDPPTDPIPVECPVETPTYDYVITLGITKTAVGYSTTVIPAK